MTTAVDEPIDVQTGQCPVQDIPEKAGDEPAHEKDDECAEQLREKDEEIVDTLLKAVGERQIECEYHM